MFPRYLPFEPWEWKAILERPDAVDCALLAGLLQAQALVRRSEFGRRHRLSTLDPISGASVRGKIVARHTAPSRLEHRLYTLFAE